MCHCFELGQLLEKGMTLDTMRAFLSDKAGPKFMQEHMWCFTLSPGGNTDQNNLSASVGFEQT